MNTQSKRVLLIEDSDDVADTIKQGLERSTRYNFDVTHLAHLRKEEVRAIRSKSFDLCIIDLRLQEGGTDKLGFLAAMVQAYRSPTSRVVVYSAYPDIANVVKAMRLGADTFISKAEFPPHELPSRLEQMLEDEQRASEQAGEQEQAFKKHGAQWQKVYAGKVVVVLGEEVVASGEGHLEALLDYSEKRQDGPHPTWPEIPQLTEIPTE